MAHQYETELKLMQQEASSIGSFQVIQATSLDYLAFCESASNFSIVFFQNDSALHF